MNGVTNVPLRFGLSQHASHEEFVARQFGERAESYLASAVHAQGKDLPDLIALAHRGSEPFILDLGCGAGHVSFNVASFARQVVAYDLSAKMLQLVARVAIERGVRNVVTARGTAERLPFQDQTFDTVLSRYSAHHWSDRDLALSEVARVTKTGGAVGIIDTVSPGTPTLDTYLQATELIRDPSHVRDYSVVEWKEALARANLRLGSILLYRVRLEFESWVKRMRTPEPQVCSIRALQVAMYGSVGKHFEIEVDGSFTVDVAFFHCFK